MVEPFLMLTVLNCFFMFSSTVTTCALWLLAWQYRKHRHSCSGHVNDISKLRLKKSKSYEDRSLKDGKKNRINDMVGYTGSKSSVKKRSKRGTKKNRNMCHEISSTSKFMVSKACDAKYPEIIDNTRHGATFPSSETRSTVVMEVSAVQKVVKIYDSDCDQQKIRRPNETVIYTRYSPNSQRKVDFVAKESEDKNVSTEIADNKIDPPA